MLPATGSSWPAWYVVALLAFGALLAVIAAHDARTRRIPNALVYPGIAAAVLVALLHPVAPWWTFVLSGVVAGVALGGIAAFTGGMGFGDAKLAALIGLVLGWPATLVGLFAAFAVGAIGGVALIAAGVVRRRDPIPFAPALALGAAIGLVAGPTVSGWLWPGLGVAGVR